MIDGGNLPIGFDSRVRIKKPSEVMVKISSYVKNTAGRTGYRGDRLDWLEGGR